jgi:cytochrome c peroxidase
VTKDPLDFGHFKVPDLRNVALTAPYMHDGRFATLEEVLDHYDHGIQDFKGLDPVLRDENGKPKRLNLSPDVRKNILLYLNLMTDPAYIHNKEYSNPYR